MIVFWCTGQSCKKRDKTSFHQYLRIAELFITFEFQQFKDMRKCHQMLLNIPIASEIVYAQNESNGAFDNSRWHQRSRSFALINLRIY